MEKSEMFPDYSSVLREAIVYAIDLKGLHVDSENIDGLIWSECNLNSVSFHNCSMKRNVFFNCSGNLHCYNCNLEHSKIKHSQFADVYFSDCELIKLSVRDSISNNSFIVNSNLSDSTFWDSQFDTITFNSCNLTNTLYHECTLGTSFFVHSEDENNWYHNASFIECELHSCDMSHIKDLSQLYFWEINIHDIEFATPQRFSIINNNRSQIIYAIDSDVIWWKPYIYSCPKIRPFRHSVKEFMLELNNNFPTTDIYPEMEDFDVEEELLAVSVYIKYWDIEKS